MSDVIRNKIDDSVLSPNASQAQVNQAAQRVIDHSFNSLVIRPKHISSIFEEFVGAINQNLLRISTVIDFPIEKFNDLNAAINQLGVSSTQNKLTEARAALVQPGVFELDPVIKVQDIVDDNLDAVADQLKQFMSLAKEFEDKLTQAGERLVLKPIFSTGVLLEKARQDKKEDELEYIRRAVKTLVTAYKEFLNENKPCLDKLQVVFKNSTGFTKGIPNIKLGDDVNHMHMLECTILGEESRQDLKEGSITLKAAGGIDSFEKAERLQTKLGASLAIIGTSKPLEVSGIVTL